MKQGQNTKIGKRTEKNPCLIFMIIHGKNIYLLNPFEISGPMASELLMTKYSNPNADGM